MKAEDILSVQYDFYNSNEIDYNSVKLHHFPLFSLKIIIKLLFVPELIGIRGTKNDWRH